MWLPTLPIYTFLDVPAEINTSDNEIAKTFDFSHKLLLQGLD